MKSAQVCPRYDRVPQHFVNAEFTDYVDTNFHDTGDSLPLLDITTLRALITHVGRLKQARDAVEKQ